MNAISSPSSIKSIAKAYAEQIWNAKDLSAIDRYVDSHIILHSPLGDFHGIEAMKKIVHVWLKGFGDLQVNNALIIGENDLVTIQWQAKGTHNGEFKGKQPTGKSVFYSGVTIYRISESKISEYWAYVDMQHLLSQIS